MSPFNECCVCYSTTEDIDPALKNSFIVIPCGGKHEICFSCFMRNTNTKCPMCRFNYKTMKNEQMTINVETFEPNDETFEPNEDLAFIDNWWIRLKENIPDLLPVIKREVFDKGLNVEPSNRLNINFEWIENAIIDNQEEPDIIGDMVGFYEVCCRMYLTKMLVMFKDIENDDYTDFALSVNDFIQHEADSWD